jgi:hypothetical protein
VLLNHNHETDGRDVTFILPYGVTYFGVGLSHLEGDTDLYVNGTKRDDDIRDLTNFSEGGPDHKNGYLYIEATDGDLIHSVTFDVVSPTSSDSIIFDHIAFTIPGPASLALLGCFGLMSRRRR